MRLAHSFAPAAASAPTALACPPPRPGPPPPPAPIPPGPPRDFRGLEFGRTTGRAWIPGDEFALRIGARVGAATGYGTWADAVAAGAAASSGRAGAIAICDDRGRLYLHRIDVRSAWWGTRPLRIGERGETGYLFHGPQVRGIVDGDRLASRGDCLVRWVPMPPPPARA